MIVDSQRMCAIGVDSFYSGVAWIFFSTGRAARSLAFTRVESSYSGAACTFSTRDFSFTVRGDLFCFTVGVASNEEVIFSSRLWPMTVLRIRLPAPMKKTLRTTGLPSLPPT